MKSELHWLAPIFLFLSLIAQAVSREVEVRLTSPKLQPITPGRILTASFLVANNTDRDEELVEEIKLPSGWHKISPIAGPFFVKANTTEVRLLALLVPATTAADRFEITYLVKSRRDYALADSAAFSAQVLAVKRIELLVDDKPQAVIAGEEYTVKLRVINRGNSRTTAKLAIKSAPQYPVRFGTSLLSLDPGSSQDLRLNIKTDEALRAKITHILTIRAAAESDAAGTNVEATVSTAAEIIPKVTGEMDPYHRLPVRLRFTVAKDEGKEAGFQAEFSGAGSLDESGRRKIDFLFRGPDLQEQSIHGTRDEYRVSYFDKLFNVHLGDRNYALSPLTERYGYGRGAEVNIASGPVAFGALYMQSRWREDDFSETGLFYTFPFRTDVSLEYQNIRRADRLLPAAYDFEERSVRMGIGHSFGKVSVQGFIEQGEMNNRLSRNDDGSLERYSFYVYYRPTARQSYSFYTRIGESTYTATPEKSQTFGASANWNLTDKLSVNLQYARNSYDSALNRVQDVAYSSVT